MSAAAPVDGAVRGGVQDARQLSAFRAARRHSGRVRLLRLATIGGAVGLVAGIVVVTAFDPFGRVVHGVSVQGAAVEGSKVTMSAPKLSGYQKDGRPYEIQADRAVQDIRTPSFFELFALKARLTLEDRTSTRLQAATGSYNSATETLTLGGGAVVNGDNGLNVTAQDAVVEFKSSSLSTDKPVSVALPGKRITGDSMRITEGGKHVSLDGHVHTEIAGDVGPDSAAPSEAGSP